MKMNRFSSFAIVVLLTTTTTSATSVTRWPVDFSIFGPSRKDSFPNSRLNLPKLTQNVAQYANKLELLVGEILKAKHADPASDTNKLESA